ncbi:ABC transporter ATP-binding protein [Clostridium sp. 'deep sea']|uniref:ABC transporter ATP-binding protein n=1 Tax=Clostridium sp. 'deep sea' TaxID=2779445 RepID=UPI0018966C12|nr:ABC transporter ATP-binding protein [Clostridium sp. 'deep sea']QOR35406.1 ABC transporter ATP-binding protein [Clostridium sp. 'deep sea']
MLDVNNVSFNYKNSNIPILNNLNLQVKQGEVIGVVGLSGCGKTTLMHVLNGLIPQRINGEFTGIVKINNINIASKDLSELATIVGTVFQDPDNQLFFSRVEDEIAFGPENLCVEPAEIKQRIKSVTQLLNIEHLLPRNPNTLSGGEKQLVVIAAILSLNVKLLILDECMTQVDTQGKELIMNAIKKLKQNKTTIIMVEHDYNNLSLADKVYHLKDGQLTLFNGDMKK